MLLYGSLVADFRPGVRAQVVEGGEHLPAEGPFSADGDTFRLLLRFLQQSTGKEPTSLRIADLDAPAMLSFLDLIEQQRQNQVQSRNVRLAAIRSFFAEPAFPSSLS